jgi:hypothetical protein
MNATIEELRDLEVMRENTRRSVAALEVCWSCQRVSDCATAIVDDSVPVWLCAECLSKFLSEEELNKLLWPAPWEGKPDV